MRPLSGTTSPLNCPIKVDLPAPFGPIIACSSPAGSTSEIPSAATTPPNRLVRPSISRSVLATATPRHQTVDAAVDGDRHDEQQGPKDQIRIFRKPGKPLLQNQKRYSADQWPEHRLHTAQHHHDDKIARTRPVHHGRTDKVGMIGKQRTRQSTH